MSKMYRKTIYLLFALVAASPIYIGYARARPPRTPGHIQNLERFETEQLARRLPAIDQRLETLARPNMRSGIGTLGYLSKASVESDVPQWLRIDFETEATIDEVVLVPAIWHDAKRGYSADGFPECFKIWSGIDDESEPTLLASFTKDDGLLPRAAPVVVPCDSHRAKWVRLEATRLTSRAWDGRYVLALAEILVFSGEENIALRQTVTSETPNRPRGSVSNAAVVDGTVPYLLNSSIGEQSKAFLSRRWIGERPVITIDLERPEPVNRIRLHAVDISDTVPRTNNADLGIPLRFQIEGSDEADFSDVKTLLNVDISSAYQTAPVMNWRFPAVSCRYVRLVATRPYVFIPHDPRSTRIGFAEIELYANGQNVSVHKPVSTDVVPILGRNAEALTDGRNYYGSLLSQRQWMEQLAERHDQEKLRPQIASELNRRYQQQSTILTFLTWSTFLLGGCVLALVLTRRHARERAVSQTQHRIAADLHDELGANFHAIGLLSDLADGASEDPERLRPLLAKIRELTERSGKAAAYCCNMLESEGLYDDIVVEMRRESSRIMADFDYELTFEGEEQLCLLSPRRRIDLFLFFKECLINIIRHSGGTAATTHISADAQDILLIVTDNGNGLNFKNGVSVPGSLTRRTKLLGGSVTAESSEGNGTTITLQISQGVKSKFPGRPVSI